MNKELLDYIRNYLDDQCTIQDLEAWVLSNLQRILDSGDEASIELANEIDADLVEIGEGLVDEAAFREHLHSLISMRETIPIDFPGVSLLAKSYTTVAVETIRNEFEDPKPTVEVHLDHVFA